MWFVHSAELKVWKSTFGLLRVPNIRLFSSSSSSSSSHIRLFRSCQTQPIQSRKVKVAHSRLPSVRFRRWSRFLAVSLQDVSHKPGGRLPLLSARPAVTPATLKRATTNFAAWWTEAQWVWTVCLRLLPDSIATATWTRALLRLSPAR